MDHLHRLPTEILLQILQSCPDLSSLFNLVNTSRRLSSIFNNHTVETVEVLLTRTGGVPDPIRRLMRLVIHIRAGVFKHHRWEDLSGHSLHSLGDHMNGIITPLILRKFLQLAHNIHVLAHVCLDRWLQRCRRAIPQKAKVIELPTWVEEQRVVFSIWRVQYFYELKIARLKGRLQEGWEAEMLSALESATLDSVGGTYFDGVPASQKEQIMTVLEVIEEINREQVHEEETSNVGKEEPSSSVAATKSFRLPNVVERAGGTASVDPGSWKQCDNSRRPSWISQRRAVYQLVEEPIAWTYLTNHAKPPDAVTQPQKLPLQPFRKFGLFLWDQRRMADELGLWPDAERKILEFDEGRACFSAWQRLLTPEEVARAVKDEEENDW